MFKLKITAVIHLRKQRSCRMSRQIDFLMEENKLEEIQGILHNEVLKYLDRRKVVTGQILEARQKYIEEYKDDEDQVIDYFDHENYVKEEAYKFIYTVS